MRRDGSILSVPGYDSASGIYLVPAIEIDVASHPARADARRAVDLLLDVVSDFPAGAAAKSAWLAGVVTVAVRPAIEGPTPMIIVDASTRGAGKSLMVDLAALIATGRLAARMIYSRDNAEVRKVITSIALIGDPMVLLDNVTGELGCPALDAALTADVWRDRVLGSSTMTAELPLRITWWATGNGLLIGADLVRRSLLVRLEPQVERPEERTGWRYPRLVDHVRRHRAELLGAALTIARAYVVAGSPDLGLRPMGSYERWSDLVRSALVWAGTPDPCDTIGELRASDVRGDALRGALEAWPSTDLATAAELIDAARPGTAWRTALLEWVPARGGELPTARALGYALRSVRRRIVSGWTIDAAKDRTGTTRWRRVRPDAGDAGDAGDVPPPRGCGPFISPIGETSPSSPSSPAERDPGEDDDEPTGGPS
jgi:putative DNA primase/helicase